MAMMGGPAPHPLIEKFTDKHIDKFLEYSHKDDINEFRFAIINKVWLLVLAVLGLGFLGFLIVYLAPTHKDLLTDILKIIVAFGGGVGAGYGPKRRTDRER